MRYRSLVTIVTSTFLALGSGCSKLGSMFDDNFDDNSCGQENERLKSAVADMAREITSHGGSVGYSTGPDGKFHAYVQWNVSPSQPAPVVGDTQPGGPTGTAVPVARVVAEASTTKDGPTWFEHFKSGLTEGDTIYKHMSVKDSDPDKRKLSGTFPSGDGVVIVCDAFIPGQPGNGRPPKIQEGCPYTIWKKFKRPNLQAMIDHAFNTVMRGKTINGIDTLTFTDAEAGYKALTGKFMETYTTELDTAIDGLLNPEVEIDGAKQKVNLPAFYATVRERHGSRVINKKTVLIGYSIDGDGYTDNGKAISSRVKIDYLSESAIRAGVRKKVGIAVKAIGLIFMDNMFYHPADVDDDGKPTRTPSPYARIPVANYTKATFVYAAHEENRIDKTNPLCQPQSIDLTPAKAGTCAIGSGAGCYNEGVTPGTDDVK